MSELMLSPGAIEAIARRVAELLATPPAPTRGWLTAAQVADTLGVTTGYVYAHAEEFGARKLGDGPRARLRFDAAVVGATSTIVETPGKAPRRTAGRPRGTGRAASAGLLPVHGREVPRVRLGVVRGDPTRVARQDPA